MGAELDTPTAKNSTYDRVRQVAIWLFAERGYAATGIRDVAKHSNITTASIYHYVADKQQLLFDMIRDDLAHLNARTAQQLEDVDRPEEQLSLLVSGLVATHAINLLSSRVGDREIHHFAPDTERGETLLTLRDTYEAHWNRVLRAGRSAGVFRFDDETLTRLALISMCTSLQSWYRDRGSENLEYLCRRFVAIALAAVRAENDGEPVDADRLPIVDFSVVERSPWEPPTTATPAAAQPDRDSSR